MFTDGHSLIESGIEFQMDIALYFITCWEISRVNKGSVRSLFELRV